MKKTFTYSSIGLYLICVAFSSCKKEESRPSPAIESFTPASGHIGQLVTISGMNFGSSQSAAPEVDFNGVAATVQSFSDSQISVIVPAGATTGKINVKVNGRAALSLNDFTVIDTQTITSFSLTRGTPGTTITIIGTNFSENSADNIVKFNNVPAQVVYATSTSLTVSVPQGSTTGNISVEIFGVSVVSAASFEVLIDIPRNGLIAFYPFNGNANDAAGNNLNGTRVSQNGNSPTLATDRFGNASGSYSFSPTGGYIDLGNSSLLQIKGQLTIAGWYYNNTSANQIYQMISKVFYDPTASSLVGYSFYHAGDVVYFKPDYTVSTNGVVYSTSAMPTLRWVFLAVVIDGSDVKLYRDGVQALTNISQPFNFRDETRGNLVIGCFNQGQQVFSGSIDDVAIYNRALTATEVTQLFQQTITKY